MRLLIAVSLPLLALAGCLTEEAEETPQTLFEEEQRASGERPGRTIQWAAPGEASIRPGVQMSSPSGQCTSNFVYTSPDNLSIYLGFAAHCVSEGEATDTDGCLEANEPMEIGTEIDIQGASRPGRLIYNSWLTMQESNESDDDACRFNDFAVVELHPDDHGSTSPAVKHFGGPNGIAEDAPAGTKVISFGNSGARPGPEELDYKEGYIIGGGGWSYQAYTATPGIPGDSGSNMLTGDGRALGIVVTLGAVPPGVNGVTSLDKALAYANERAQLQFQLETWELLAGGVLPG